MTKVRSSTGLEPFSPVEPRKHEANITAFLGQCFDYEELLLETADCLHHPSITRRPVRQGGDNAWCDLGRLGSSTIPQPFRQRGDNTRCRLGHDDRGDNARCDLDVWDLPLSRNPPDNAVTLLGLDYDMTTDV